MDKRDEKFVAMFQTLSEAEIVTISKKALGLCNTWVRENLNLVQQNWVERMTVWFTVYTYAKFGNIEAAKELISETIHYLGYTKIDEIKKETDELLKELMEIELLLKELRENIDTKDNANADKDKATHSSTGS